ncbi:MAG: SH3 domain-containing protein [Candidatus Omnitrophica bacterium]|nr:SH3 domain-containing protein [Candidatus Omnitrophota bacterium]
MHTAGFWTARHTSVDDVVMSSGQIEAFNRRVRKDLKLTKDIFSLADHFQSESLMDTFHKTLADFTNKGYYTAQGIRDDESFLEKARNNMNLNGVVSGMAPRYGLVIHEANQRFLPTQEGLYAQKGDIDFDELQNSALEVGTALAVVHQSLDGKWVYVLSALSDGWVATDHVGLGDIHQIKKFVESKDFVVVTSPQADIFLDEKMRSFNGDARMGVKLPLVGQNEHQWIVQVPTQDKEGRLQLVKGYIPKAQAHEGYLSYTARMIYNQALDMLDKPYGWGDRDGRQDCSRFLQMVYATVGIQLPRDSKDQAQTGEVLASFNKKTTDKEKLQALQNASGALTILPMKGHIMLYLGMIDGIPYAIHETSGYSKTIDEKEIKYVLNRVVVSDLSLGEGSRKGSLLRRLSKVIEIR